GVQTPDRTESTTVIDWSNLLVDGRTWGFLAVPAGFVVPDYSETYTLFTQSDDDARLYVTGALKALTDTGGDSKSASTALTAGQAYLIRLERRQGSTTAVSSTNPNRLRAQWSSASQLLELIP